MLKSRFYEYPLAAALILVAANSPDCLAHGGGGGGGGGHGGGGHFGSGHFGGGSFHPSSMSSLGSTHAFGGGHPGIYSHSGNFSPRTFGTYHGWNQLNNSFGYWSSWSNPSLNYIWGWGNQGMPHYASGPGFSNLSAHDAHDAPISIPDQEGNIYSGTNYRLDQDYVSNYSWTDATLVSQQSAVHDEPARYRLGPDTDIINGGKVVIRVSSLAYMLITPAATQLISTESGLPIVPLSTDPSLLWHLSAELKRQSSGLVSAIQLQAQNKQIVSEGTDEAGNSGESGQSLQSVQAVQEGPAVQGIPAVQGAKTVPPSEPVESGDGPKLKTLRTTAELLRTAQTGLGPTTAVPPEPAPPPVADADELFSGTWVTRDAKFVVLKRADGTVVYTDGNSWFSDLGKTKIPGPSVEQFKRVVLSYVSNLSADAPKAQECLKQFRKQSKISVRTLNDTLKKLQSESRKGGDNQQQEYTEAISRLEADLSAANSRLQNLNQMHDELPKELATVNVLLKNWH